MLVLIHHPQFTDEETEEQNEVTCSRKRQRQALGPGTLALAAKLLTAGLCCFLASGPGFNPHVPVHHSFPLIPAAPASWGLVIAPVLYNYGDRAPPW